MTLQSLNLDSNFSLFLQCFFSLTQKAIVTNCTSLKYNKEEGGGGTWAVLVAASLVPGLSSLDYHDQSFFWIFSVSNF